MGSSPSGAGQQLQPISQTKPVSIDDLRNQYAQLQSNYRSMGLNPFGSSSEGGQGSGAYRGLQQQQDMLQNRIRQLQGQQGTASAHPATLGGLPVYWGPGPPGG